MLLHLYFVCVIVTHRHTGCTFFSFKKYLLLCVWIFCLNEWMCVHYVLAWCPPWLEEGVRSFAARTVDDSEPAYGFWELNLSSLQRAASAPNYRAFSSASRKCIPKQSCNFASWIFYAHSSGDDVYKSWFTQCDQYLVWFASVNHWGWMCHFAMHIQVLKRFSILGLISLIAYLIYDCIVEISAIFTLVWAVSYCWSFYVKRICIWRSIWVASNRCCTLFPWKPLKCYCSEWLEWAEERKTAKKSSEYSLATLGL